MSRRNQIYKKIKRGKHIAEMLPLLHRLNDRTIVCKNGSLVSVLKLTGRDYTGMSTDQYNELYAARKAVFERNKDYIDVDIISIKRKTKASSKLSHSDHLVLSLVNDAYSKNFDEVFRTSHFLVLTTKKLNTLQKIGTVIDSSFRVNLEDELNSMARDLVNQLDEFNPVYLEKGRLNSFFATLINGRETYVDSLILNDPTFNQCLANQAVYFPKNKDYCHYGLNDNAIYSGFLSVANYPDEPNQKTLESVFNLPVEFIVYQSFQSMSQKTFDDRMEKRRSQISNWGKHGDLLIADLKELSDKVENGELSMVDHFFSVEVLASTTEQLDNDISLVKSKLETNGAIYYRESLNIEALFWSRFPTEQKLNVRHRPITSENAAHYATFNSIGEGFDSCVFGDRPVTLFKTDTGSQFSFTFHDSPQLDGQPLGHTAIIGGTGAGKTTLMSFLISQCATFEGFKAIVFDRLHGLDVFTNLMDGDYLDFGKNVELNPFQIDDTQANRTFLIDWLCTLLNINEQSDNYIEHQMIIERVVSMNFNIEDRKSRCFNSLLDVFGPDGGELRNRLSKWLENGAYGAYFNGHRDSLRFDKSIVTFDATLVLDMPELLPKLADYIFNRIWSLVNDNPVPNLIFLDEAQRFLLDPIFFKRVQEFANEIRKKLGVLCLAFQNASKMENLPNNAGNVIKEAMANYLIYPNPGADKQSYCEFLGLTDMEFEWIKNNNPKNRKVLFKRRESGESVILDVDLSSLKTEHFDLVKAFDSGAKAVSQLHQLKRDNPIDWKIKYLSR
uniref:ATPase required for both assembly of type IV secretion complex and secretion of T-DNA complex, VirB4 n=1 Tax=Enterovibrio norvegicus TaxID=188144 RepID=A0A0H4A2X6_9GAMM|nr:ATPase required for both assembly of type IV secretion complex and secretion of T-DNA complex, VirB4 [Enterovibrio norvegicus]